MLTPHRALGLSRLAPALGLMVLLSLPGKPSLADEAVWSALKEGGKVVLMRHAHVDLASGNPRTLAPGNCSAEVNLSNRGLEQANRIGEAFRSRNIPVGDVLTSPYCRCIDTGMIAFGKAAVAQFLVVPLAIPAEQRSEVAGQNTEAALQLIAQHRGAIDNLVMITHRPNIAAISLDDTVQGEFVVLTPIEEDFDIVGKILIDIE